MTNPFIKIVSVITAVAVVLGAVYGLCGYLKEHLTIALNMNLR